MTITLNGTTGITTPSLTSDAGITADGISFADGTPSNTLVTTTGGNVGIGTASPTYKLQVSGSDPRIAITHTTHGTWFTAAGWTGANDYSIVQAGVAEGLRVDSSNNLRFNSGYGSVATAYGCRAWVNFNGTGTVAIRASGNVSSITDNGIGDYTVNFSTAMPDANYAVSGTAQETTAVGSANRDMTVDVTSTGSVRVFCTNYTGGLQDPQGMFVVVHR